MNIFIVKSCVRALLLGLATGGAAIGLVPPAAASPPEATAAADAPLLRWRDVYYEPDAEIEHLAGAVSTSGELWLMVGKRQDGVLGGPYELELWRLGGDGERIRTRFDPAVELPIQSQRPMHMLATPSGVAIAMQTGRGAHVVVHTPGAPVVVHGPVTAAGDAALLAMGVEASGQPALVTARGLVSLDEPGENWTLRWKKPADVLIMTAVASDNGRFGLLTTAVSEQPRGLSLTAVDLSGDSEPAVHTTPLAPGGTYALGKSLAALGSGGFVLADPSATAGGVRWQLTTVDPDLNIVGSNASNIPGIEAFRARLVNWNDKLVLLAPAAGNSGGAAYGADEAGRLSRLPLPGIPGAEWRNTIRLDLYPVGDGDAIVVESAHVLEDDARTTRAQITVTRLSPAAATGVAALGTQSTRNGDRP